MGVSCFEGTPCLFFFLVLMANQKENGCAIQRGPNPEPFFFEFTPAVFISKKNGGPPRRDLKICGSQQKAAPRVAPKKTRLSAAPCRPGLEEGHDGPRAGESGEGRGLGGHEDHGGAKPAHGRGGHPEAGDGQGVVLGGG